MTGSWWSDLPPAQVTVPCAGQQHTLRWADGELSTPDHPQPERERALQALGGEPARCLQLADLWAGHVDDLDVLVLASRGPSDPLGSASMHDEDHPDHVHGTLFADFGHAGDDENDENSDEDQDEDQDEDNEENDGEGVSGGVHIGAVRYHGSYRPMSGWRPGHGHGWVGDDEEGPGVEQVDALLVLGGGLPERLSATVIATWAARIRGGSPEVEGAWAALHAALLARVSECLRTWLADPELQVEVDMLPTGAESTVHRRKSGALHVAVPFDWLSEVWVPRRALVLDRFVLASERVAPNDWRLLSVASDLGTPTSMSVRW